MLRLLSGLFPWLTHWISFVRWWLTQPLVADDPGGGDEEAALEAAISEAVAITQARRARASALIAWADRAGALGIPVSQMVGPVERN